MKTKLIVSLYMVSTFSIAQSLPPACEQYLVALDVCTQNTVQYLEKVDIKRAKAAKLKQKEVRSLRDMIKKEVAIKGVDGVAEYCLRPEFTRLMFDNLNELITPLALTQALNSQCYERFQEIRVPQR